MIGNVASPHYRLRKLRSETLAPSPNHKLGQLRQLSSFDSKSGENNKVSDPDSFTKSIAAVLSG
jgi:hypothetical protein